jgi:hypothetical protein
MHTLAAEERPMPRPETVIRTVYAARERFVDGYEVVMIAVMVASVISFWFVH